MALTEKQAFKVGFLLRCADEGLTIEETHQRVKQAIDKYANPLAALAGAGTVLGGLAKHVLPFGAESGLALGIGAPVAAGAGLGYMAAKMRHPGEEVLDQAKRDEVIGEYERLADEAQRKARAKRLANATGQNVSIMAPSI